MKNIQPSESFKAGSEISQERRLMVRYPTKALTLVIRECDKMQTGLDGQLLEVSVGGLGIILRTSLEVNEQIKLILTNEIQRFRKETRGAIRHVTKRDDGTYQTGIELFARLTPLEVSMLKMGIPKESDSDEPVWV